MARIPNEQLDRIKQEISLLSLVQSQGLNPVKQGKDYVVCCPFHDEQTPSCIISPKSNLFNCFGCGKGGSVVDWVMKTQGVSFRHACEILQKDLSVISEAKPVKQSTTKQISSSFTASSSLAAQTLLKDIVGFYHEALKQSPEALAYLEKRGLADPDLIDRFKLGFANRTLGYRLPSKQVKEGRELRSQLQAVGIMRESGHEHFNGSIVVPITNDEGQVCGMYGRKLLGKKLRKGTPQHLYLPGPHAGVWNAEGLAGQQEVILCEALIDAMTFWVNGYRNVTASYGTQGFTDDHVAAFKQHGIERVLIAYDRDEAGNTAAEKLAEDLQKQGFACYRLQFPKGMDANECALNMTPANKSLGVVIRSAQWLSGGTERPQVNEVLPVANNSSLSATAPCVALPPASVQSLAASVEEKEPAPKPEVMAPAQAIPDAPSEEPPMQANDKEIHFSFGLRKYRVRGVDKNKSFEAMKVNILISCEENLHVDTFDLYSSKHRQGFIKVAALELEEEESTIKKDLGRVLLKLEERQAQLINGEQEDEKKPTLSEQEHHAAMALLRDPELLNRILSDFSRCGVVGEETNKLVGYLAASSRKLDRPLAVIIQSTSAAGKSSLMDAILNLMPENERVQYSAMTGQSLFYMGETNLKHKILAIAEEEGASNASYALKLLQSEGEITIASTGKDEASGDLVTKEYTVQGPVMLFLTTTAIDIDEELLNRCLVLTVNESREQTRAIHNVQRQRRTLAGLQAKLEKDALVTLHRNAQTLLKPLAVINPYADQLTFLDDKTRTRRDHEKYLTLIDSIALLHQYQRDVKTVQNGDQALHYIEVHLSDIDTANRLAHEVLGRTLDELPAQTRKLLKLMQSMVQDECKKQSVEQQDFRFSRREVREVVRWSDTALKVHMARLVELEYLLVHRGRGGRYDYELLFDGGDDQHLMGLIDVEKLTYDANRSGQQAKQPGPGQPLVRGQSDQAKSLQPIHSKALLESGLALSESTIAAKKIAPSHRKQESTVTL